MIIELLSSPLEEDRPLANKFPMKGVLEKLSRGVFVKWQERAFELDEATAKLASKDPKKRGSKLKTVGTVVASRAVAAQGKRTYCFDVELEGCATLRCSAESAPERENWLAALQRASSMGGGGAAAAAADARGEAFEEAAAGAGDAAGALAAAVGAAVVAPGGAGIGAAVAEATAAAVEVVGVVLLPLQPVAHLVSGLLRAARKHAQLSPALHRLVLVLESLQRCLGDRGARLAGEGGALAELLEASLARALQEVERIDANPGVLKALAADALKKRLEVLEDDTAKLAGFCTFAMASEAPTRVQLERCIDAAQRQSAEQLAALIGGLEGRLGALAAGQQRLGSQIDVLVDKKKAVETMTMTVSVAVTMAPRRRAIPDPNCGCVTTAGSMTAPRTMSAFGRRPTSSEGSGSSLEPVSVNSLIKKIDVVSGTSKYMLRSAR